jgi:CubicO group peptidase (beta-lactamase class C family)
VGEAEDSVGTSTQFRIMSMTKMVCTVAALQQRERGELHFDAPVADYCPGFADVQVLDGWDEDKPKLRPPATQATVRHLVTHTSGLGYWFSSADLAKYEAVTGIPNIVPGSDEAFKAPMLADPGTTYNYGINTDWLGKVVEAIAGKTLDVVVKENVTGPLGMDHTGFAMTDEEKANAVMVHVRGEDGRWTSIGNVLNESPDWWAGGHGLYSTPRDYIRFERALLRGGELDGTRILEQSTVDEAFTNQIGEFDFPAEIPSGDPASSADINLGPGFKWGYGLLLNTEDIPGMRRAGTGAWAGLCNTHFWVDRTSGICASIYSNCLPFVAPEALALYQDFERAVYASL